MKTSGVSLGLFNAPVLCLFWLTKHSVDSVQLSAPEVVTGAYGGSVTVSCQYDSQFRDYTKYWCKGSIYELCDIVVRTPRRQQKGTSSIADDKEAGVFTVTITSLTASDDDMYWCVIARSGRNIFSGVKLSVSNTESEPFIAKQVFTCKEFVMAEVITTTTTTATTIPEQDEISWWATLRWILFILMLCCLVSTHIAEWRITAAGKIRRHQQLQFQTSVVESHR